MLDNEVVKDGHHHNPAKHRRVTMGEAPWCRCVQKTLFLHGIGKDRLQNVKTTTRRRAYKHMYTQRSPYHAMPFDSTSYFCLFWRTVLKKIAILLLGRISTFKQDDIKFLPSNPGKAMRYLNMYIKITFTYTHRKYYVECWKSANVQAVTTWLHWLLENSWLHTSK